MLRITQIIILFYVIFIMSSCAFMQKANKEDRVTLDNVSVQDTIDIKEGVSSTDGLNGDFEVADSLLVTIDFSTSPEPVDIQIVDSMEIVNRFLSDSVYVKHVFKNKYTSNSNISENLSMVTGSALITQLERLADVKFFNKYEFQTDVKKLNKYGFSPGYVPSYSDSVYESRIEMLNILSPCELIFNSHVKSYINVYARKGKKQTSRMLGLKEIYFPIFEEVLDKYNLPLELKYLAVVESALNPTAGSHAGAKGLWQFMYATGKRYGLTNNSLVDDRFDPYKATEAAVLHLKDLFDIYNSWELALAAYNSGPGNVNRAIRRAGGVRDYWAIWPYLPRETRGYIPAFIAVNYVFSFATEHNIYPTHPGILHYNIDSVTVRDVLSLEQVSEYLHIDLDDLIFLNPAYKKGIIPATKSKSYILRLPRSKVGLFLDREHSIYNYKSTKGIEKEKLLAQIKKASERTIYIVRSGDNLGSIAKKHRTSVRNIKSWNNMRSSRIYPGQKLTIFPSGSGKSIAQSKSNKSKNTNSNNTYHKVRQGETLGHIAQQYGISVKSLRRLNGMRGSKLSIGQQLVVSSKPKKGNKENENKEPEIVGNYTYHTISSGDTLWDLARKYGTSVSMIKKWNNISNSHRLKLGDKLIVAQNT